MRGPAGSAEGDVAALERGAERSVQRWLVLEAGPNPSTDYYLRARLRHAAAPVRYASLDDAPRAEDLDDGTFVAVVRYLNPRWALALARARARLAGFAYFMDDDLWDPRAASELPLGYRFRIATRATAFAPFVRGSASRVWLSSPALLAKYSLRNAEVLPPRPLGEPPRAIEPVGDVVRIAYHGTRSHLAEMRWLAPVLGRALARAPNLAFDAIGGPEVERVFARLPRTRVVPPMSWPAYRAYASRAEAHVALAPLVRSAFNDSRTFTKVFDHARLGAVGVYSSPGPYDTAVEHDRTGLLLPLHPEVWVDALVALALDRSRLDRLRRASAALGG